MQGNTESAKIGVFQPQETLAADVDSISQIEEMLLQNKQTFKSNDSNNCSFEDAEVEGIIEMVEENIQNCEPDKLAKQLRNKEILEERKILMSRRQIILENPPKQKNELSIDEKIQQLLEEYEFESIQAVYEDLDDANERIQRYATKAVLLKKAKNDQEKCNNFLKKHAQLVQPKIQKLLEDLELDSIEDAIEEKENQEKRLKKLAITSVKNRQTCIDKISLIDEILNIVGRPISQPDIEDDGHNKQRPEIDKEEKKNNEVHPKDPIIQVQQFIQPSTKVDVESLFQREKEDAENQAAFIKLAPDSFEKSVRILTHILYQIIHNDLKPNDPFLNVPTSKYNDLIQNHLMNIKQTYIGEIIKNNEIYSRVNQIEESNGTMEQFKKILDSLKQIQPLISKFSFQEFFSYIQKANQVAEKITNIDIALLLGTSGAGKSTSIHYICGSEMIETQHNDLKHIAFGKVVNQDLLNVKVSPYSRSETRYIRPINIKVGTTIQEVITLVDSPGLFDLKNAEVDVSNQIGIIKALSSVKSVKPFIVLSYKKIGARGENLKEILTFYSQMVVDSGYLEYFNFFFSHVDKGVKIENLIAKIADILKQLNAKEQQNERLVQFLKVIINKAEQNKLFIIDPLDSKKVQTILNDIRNSQKIPSPSSVFQKAVCEESKNKIIEQFDLHSRQIQSSFKKASAEKVEFMLSELQQFCDIMDSDQEYKVRLNEILRKLSLKMNEKYNEVISVFKKQLQLGNKIGEQEVGMYKSNILFMFHLESVRKKFLTEIDGNQILTHSYQDIEQEVERIIKNTFDQINSPQAAKFDSHNLHDFLQKLDILASQKEEIFIKISNDVFTEIHKNLKEIPKRATQFLETIMKSLDQDFLSYSLMKKAPSNQQVSPELSNEELKHNEMEEDKKPFQLIDEFCGIVGELERAEVISKDPLKQKVGEITKQIVTNLKNKLEKLISIYFEDFQKMNLENINNISNLEEDELTSLISFTMTKERVQSIQKYYQLLDCFTRSMNSFDLSQTLIDLIEGKQSKMNQQLNYWCTVQEVKFKRKITLSKKYSAIKSIYDELMLAQNLPALQGQTSRQNRIKMNLTKLVSDKSEEAKKHMNTIEKIVNKQQVEEGKHNNNQQISMYTLVSLKDAISTIKDLQWTVENGNEDLYDELKKELQTNLDKLVIMIEESVKFSREKQSTASEIGETEVAFKQISEIQKIANIIDIKLQDINIDEFMPDIEYNLNNIENFLTKKRVILIEDQSKKDYEIFDELLKKSECDKFSKFYNYLNILNKKDFMIRKIDEIAEKKGSKQKSFSSRINQLTEALNEFVTRQMDKLRSVFNTQLNLMKEYLNKIKTLSVNENGFYDQKDEAKADQFLEDFLVNPVDHIVNIFKMIRELKGKHQHVWKKLSPNDDAEDEDFRQPLEKFYRDVNKSIALSRQDQVQVTNNLQIINQLIPLDMYMHEQNEIKTNRIQDQYDKHFSELIHFNDNVVKTVQEFLAVQNYEEIKVTLIKLQQLDKMDKQQNYRKVQQLVHQKCNLLSQAISKESRILIQGKQLDSDKTEKLNQKSIELQEILDIIGEKLIDEKIFQRAKKELQNASTKIASNFMELEKLINNQILRSNFKEASESIQNYSQSANFGQSSYLESEDSKDDSNNYHSQTQKLNQKLDQAIKQKVKEFEQFQAKSQSNPEDFSILDQIIKNSAKEIIDNLESNHKDPDFKLFAKQMKDSIDGIIDTKFQQLSAKVIGNCENSDLLSQQIRNCLLFCTKLPDELNLKYYQQFKDLQKKFEEKQAKDSQEILEFIKNDNLSLEEVFVRITSAQYSLNNDCRLGLNQLYKLKIQDTIKQIKEQSLKSEIHQKLRELWLFQSDESIKKYLDQQSNGQYSNLQRIIQTIYNSIIKRMATIFANKESQIVFPIKIDDKEYPFNIQHLTWFTELSEKDQNLADEMIPNQEENLLNLLDTGMQQIKIHQQQFSSKITSDDPVILAEVFTIIIYMRNILPAQDLINQLSTGSDAVDSYGRPIKKKQQSLHYAKKYEEFIKLAEVADKKQFCSQLVGKFKTIEGEVMKSQFINPKTENNDKDRKAYYDKLEKQFNFIQQSQQIQQDLHEFNINANKVKTDCEKRFQANYKEIEEKAILLTDKLQGLKTAEFKNLNYQLENMKIIQEKFKNQVPSSFVQIKQKAVKMISQQTEQIKKDLLSKNAQSKAITDQLIFSQDIAQNVTELCDSAHGSIQDILDTLQKSSQDQSQISEVALLLKKSPVGSIIIEKQPIFICEQRTFWAKKIEHQEIGYVLENLMKGDGKTKISAKEKQSLKQQYDLYQDKYKTLVENNIVPFDNIPKNKEQLKINLLELTQKSKQNKIDIIAKNNIPEILANLFAIWTISDFYGNKLKCTDMTKASSIPYLLKPHPSQVISILRILGLGYENVIQQDQSKLNVVKKDQLSNFLAQSQNPLVFDNLVQIKTGEGKSITLAIVISVFALWDFEVSCACYSQYLSIRDFLSFKDLFQFLNINEKIFYGTFNQICERYINKDGDIRNLVLNRILKDSQLNVKPLPPVKKRVILIDEVDVFFSKDFYNKVYVPVAQIKHEKVSKLLDYMWQSKDDKSFTLKKMKSSQQYIECQAIFKPEFIGILEEACKDMYYAAQNFFKHDYVVQNNKIGYQEMDQISFTKSYGYNTIFAHYYHLQTPKNNQKVSQQSLDDCKGIEIYCGQFSYAEIPLYSMLILGVTGTLDSLTESENKIIQDVFQIKNFTYSPSVYGSNKLQWAELDPDQRLMICNQQDYYNELTNEIKSKIKGDNCQRAVLVFFKSLDLLKQFKESNQYINLKCEKQELSELCDEKEKESIIIQATYQNTLTVTTRSFGRGTDFICRDEVVEKNGGVHGRTARQGNKGSFQMILLDSDLQQIDVDVETQEFKNQYKKKLDYIFMQRDKKMLKEQQSDTNAVDQIRSIHQQAQEFKESLVKNDGSNSAKIAKYLVNINAGPSMKEDEFPVKTLILMDATGSMSSLLVEAKNSVNQMYERAGKILEQNGLDPHLNWIQYACYRNYSSENMILQNSIWESKADKLKVFMNSIGVSGGMGNEAVEIGFQHAVYEAQNCGNIPLRQVYLIGDMPPNTKQEVDSRRSSYQFWRGSKYEQPVYWDSELAKLKQLNVKVHTFYLNNGTVKPSFEDIAQRTGGQSCFLDVSKPNSQDILLNLFVPNILKMIGEANGDVQLGQKMVAEYMNCYK